MTVARLTSFLVRDGLLGIAVITFFAVMTVTALTERERKKSHF